MVIKWIKSNILDLIQSAGLAGVAMIAFIAWLQSVPWYLALFGLLTAVVLILIGINQYEIRKERHKKKLTQLSDKEIENTIHSWLDVPGHPVTRQVNNETLFQFDVGASNSIRVTIKRRKTDPFLFHMGVLITWKDEDKVKLANLQEPIRSNLISNLRIEMVRLGIQYSGIGYPLDTILLIESIPLDDSLTRFYFLQRITFVVRAASLVAELIEQSLRKGEANVSTLDNKGSQT